ncbi:MAG: amino acid permease [Acetilactobacillus jinshanensis]
MLPKWLGHISPSGLPEHALLIVTISSIVVGSVLPFTFITQLVSAGTLIAFMFVALAMFTLRHREGKDINEPEFKMPGYPITPIFAFVGTLIVFLNLDRAAQIYTVGWFVLGMIVYFSYGIRHIPYTLGIYRKGRPIMIHHLHNCYLVRLRPPELASNLILA